jgi:hypothetical protein
VLNDLFAKFRRDVKTDREGRAYLSIPDKLCQTQQGLDFNDQGARARLRIGCDLLFFYNVTGVISGLKNESFLS